MPFSIFANRDLRITYFTTFLHGMILWSLLYYMPLYFEAVKGYSPIITGVGECCRFNHVVIQANLMSSFSSLSRNLYGRPRLDSCRHYSNGHR